MHRRVDAFYAKAVFYNYFIISADSLHFLYVSIVSGVDINECERSEHNCSQLCDNVPGGFVCGCEAGYSLQGDGVNCTGMLSCQTLSLRVCVCELLTYYVKSARL